MFSKELRSNNPVHGNSVVTGDFNPINCLVDLDREYRIEPENKSANGKHSIDILSYIKSLPEGLLSQIHAKVSDCNFNLNDKDAVFAILSASLELLHLPLVSDYRADNLVARIARFAMKSPSTFLTHIADVIKEIDASGEDGLANSRMYINSPTQFRRHERDGLLVPNLRTCLENHFLAHPTPVEERTLLDIGASDGTIPLSFTDIFRKIICVEPGGDGFSALQKNAHARKTSTAISTLQESLQGLVDKRVEFQLPPDVILMSHVLYSANENNYDLKGVEWSLETLKPGGILVVVLNDTDPELGTGAHFRNYVGAEENGREPMDYCRYAQAMGSVANFHRCTLSFRASTSAGRSALHEMLHYLTPGEKARTRPSLLRDYTAKVSFERTGRWRFGLDHKVSILTLRKPESSDILAKPNPLPRPIQIIERSEDVLNHSSSAGSSHKKNFLKSEESNVELWAKFKDPSSPEFRSVEIRNILAIRYHQLVRYQAERVSRKLPKEVVLDDLVSEGEFGLFQAIDGYDLNRGLKFETYACPRIRGAILDGIRAFDWVPRLVRSRARQIDEATKALTASLDRAPTDDEIAQHLNISKDELTKILGDVRGQVSTVSLSRKWFETDSNKDVTELDVLADNSATPPGQSLEERDFYEWVCKGLYPQEANILLCYVELGMKMKEIGDYMDMSESRISQIMTSLTARIKLRIKDAFGDLDIFSQYSERITDTAPVEPDKQMEATSQLIATAAKVVGEMTFKNWSIKIVD